MTNKQPRPHQKECCICRDWNDLKDVKRWYSPTNEERRDYHFKESKLTHGYCPTCFILDLERNQGYTPAEIEQIVKNTESLDVTARGAE